MAMYPNATHGLMPFVKPAHKRQAARKSKMEHKDAIKSKSNDLKTYKVTLRDRDGFTYTYIIQADTAAKSMPVLCESKVVAPKNISSSLPSMLGDIELSSGSPGSSRLAMLAQGKEDLTKVDDGEKKGIFNSLISYIKRKTGGSKTKESKKHQIAVKSKRKTKPYFPKKRQRTVSAMSNLDPIQESPEEDNEDFEESDSYTHDSESSSDAEGSVES